MSGTQRLPPAPGAASIVKGLLKTAAMVAGGVLGLFVVSLFFEHPLQAFFTLLSVAGTAMMLLSVVSMLLTFRRAKTLAPLALLMSLGVSLFSTLLSLWLAADLPPAGLLVLGLIVGGAAGVGWSFTTLLYIEGDHVCGRGTVWSLLVWAVSFAANQIVTSMSEQGGGAAAVMMVVSAGLAAGNTIGLLFRVRRAAASIAASRVPAPQGAG
jgi:hypothetical protein